MGKFSLFVKAALFFVGLATLFAGIAIKTFGPFIQGPRGVHADFPKEALITYSAAHNYRQTINDCAPFSAAAVVRIAKKGSIQSSDVVTQTHWRLPNKHTPPWSLEAVIRENNIDARGEVFGRMTDSERIDWVLFHLSQRQPMILLGKKEGVLHYITLVGYTKGDDYLKFYIYDSWHTKGEEGMTVDDNGVFPGNRTLTDRELLDFWRGGGLFGFYQWYAAVIWDKIDT